MCSSDLSKRRVRRARPIPAERSRGVRRRKTLGRGEGDGNVDRDALHASSPSICSCTGSVCATYPTNPGPKILNGPTKDRNSCRPRSEFKRSWRAALIRDAVTTGGAAAVTSSADRGPARREFFLLVTIVHDSVRIRSKIVKFGRRTLGKGVFQGRIAAAAVLR